MNLFVLVAAPIVARELSAIADRILPGIQARIARITAHHGALRSHLLYFPLIGIGFAGLAVAGATPFPTTLDGLQLSKGAGEFIAAHKERFERIFNTDNMGGPLIYKFWPDLKVFVDDRFFVYGDDFVIDKYLKVFFAERGWQDVLREYDVTAAVVASKTACDTLFRASPEWTLAYDDEKTSIFFRSGAAERSCDARVGRGCSTGEVS